MIAYLDTGVLLKLYLPEANSGTVSAWLQAAGSPVWLTGLHRAELSSALQLKLFRREASTALIEKTELLIEQDLGQGFLRRLDPDWDSTWQRCRGLTRLHASATGCRTLDALHVACAIELDCPRFVTLDRRQRELAARSGLTVIDPCAGPG